MRLRIGGHAEIRSKNGEKRFLGHLRFQSTKFRIFETSFPLVDEIRVSRSSAKVKNHLSVFQFITWLLFRGDVFSNFEGAVY